MKELFGAKRNIRFLEIWDHQKSEQKDPEAPGEQDVDASGNPVNSPLENVLAFIVCFHPLPVVRLFLREKMMCSHFQMDIWT